jgi:TatD DNase family protein
MRSSGLVDFHCHLDLYPDFAAAVDDCERNGVFTLAVTTTPKAWARNQELAAPTRHVRAALGLHPQLVGERAQEIDLWEELLPKSRYVGEVGLDAGPRFYKSFGKQKEIFARILKASADARNKILTVHSVRAAKVVLDMIEAHLPPPRGRVVLHWFTGTAAEARRAVDLGCYFSINADMLANEKRSALVKALPLDRLLTETDGPFTQTDNRPSRPSDVGRALDGLALLFGPDRQTVTAAVLDNLKVLLADQE